MAPDQTVLLDRESPRFLLADTLWAAFSRVTLDEWTAYLRRRRLQGFNAVNISVLPIAHDRSLSTGSVEISAFDLDSAGRWDLDRPSKVYLDRARDLLAVAVQEGITPVLALLWCTYVPDTWASRSAPELAMTEEQTERYLDAVVTAFREFEPILVISGDENFESPVSTERYVRSLHQVRALAPELLTSMHEAPDAHLPSVLADDDALDLYTYQSGHDDGWDERAWTLAEEHANELPRRPVIDLEPCYEGHGYGSGRGRHTAASVRRASWSAVLAGAGAGLGYGAHGVWSWHREGDPFTHASFSGTPFSAEVALAFPGAQNMGHLRQIVEQAGLQHLREAQHLLAENRFGARAGADVETGTTAVYLPHAFALQVMSDLAPSSVECWNLATGACESLRVERSSDHVAFPQPSFLGDALVVLRP